MATYVSYIESKGRGVFTDKRVNKGETVESAPVIEFQKEDWEHVAETDLNCYCFYWGKDLTEGAVVLGCGSLYNHSYKPNAVFRRRVTDKIMDFIALRDIEAGEEITINYNGDPEIMDPVWFDVIE